MAFQKTDPVTAARKALEDAEAAAVAATKRAKKAADAAEAFAGEATNVDPDVDAKGFEKATARLTELRAGVELFRAREVAATARAEEARHALTAAEIAAAEARFAEVNATIDARQTKALGAVREALLRFDADLRAIAALAEEAQAARALMGSTTPGRAHGRELAGFAGAPVRALQDLVERRELAGVQG